MKSHCLCVALTVSEYKHIALALLADIAVHSPHRPRRKKKASPLLQRYERLKNTQATGGFVVG